MNLVIYARYSSDRQTEASIEGQLKVCHDYARQNGDTVIHEYVDRAMTGKTDRRPQFQQMIDDSKKKCFSAVLVYSLDRFSRDRYDSAVYKRELKKNGVRVISARENIADDPTGILMEGLLESFAQYYSAELAQKVTRGHKINAEKCQSNGGTVPLGFRVENKKYVIDEEKAPIVREIFEMYADGARVSDILDVMNARGIRTAHGATFNKNSLHSILRNRKYIGVYSYKDTVIENGVPRIISDELFNKVASILERNKANAGHNKATDEYLLTTKLFCGHCKSMMVGVSSYSKTKRKYSYYSCNGQRQKSCHQKLVRQDKVENAVLSVARQFLTDENIEKISTEIEEIYKKNKDTSKLNTLKRKHKALDAAIDNLLKALESGINIDIINQRLSEKLSERCNLEKQITQEKLIQNDFSATDIRSFLEQIRSGSIDDLKYRKMLIDTFVHSVYLYDDRMTIFFTVGDENVEINHVFASEIEKQHILYDTQYVSPKKQIPIRVSAFLHSMEIRRIKCGADERRRRGLDRGEPLFFRWKNANESPAGYSLISPCSVMGICFFSC